MMYTMPGPPSPAAKVKVLELFEGDGIPDCVIDGVARRCGVGDNGKLCYAKPHGEEGLPVHELMRLQDSLAVRPYLKAYLLRDAALESSLRNMIMNSPLLNEVAVKAQALGFAECFRVMGVVDDAMPKMTVAAWLTDHPQEPLGLLLQAHIMSVQRGDAWLVHRLEQLAPRMPSPLLRAKVLASAAELAYQLELDLAGALRNAESALQVMPQHLDSLFVKANCLHSLSGVMDGEDGGDEDSSRVTQQHVSQTSMKNVHERAQAASQAFHRYFEVAVPEHAHKPAAHFNYALQLLSACDLQYSVRYRDAKVSQQDATAAAKAAATARGLAGAASNPAQYKALLVLKQTLEEFNPHVEAAYKAGLAAQAQVPKWFTALIAPGVNTPRCVKENLEQRQWTAARIKALEQERGGVPGAQAAAAGSSSSSINGVAAAGARHGAGSSSSSSSRTASAAASGAGSSSSSAAPPATDDQLRAKLLQLVAASDLNVVSYKELHQQLEAIFQMDLSHKKSFLKQVLVDNIPGVTPTQQSGSSSRSSAPASAPSAAAAGSSGDAAESSSCCKVCSARSKTLMRCSRCKAVKYCSAACQTQDWKTHKAVCVKKA